MQILVHEESGTPTLLDPYKFAFFFSFMYVYVCLQVYEEKRLSMQKKNIIKGPLGIPVVLAIKRNTSMMQYAGKK